MVLVDTSVLISYLKNVQNPKTDLFKDILARGLPYGISAYTYQEVLQGAKGDLEYKRLHDFLDLHTVYFLPAEKATYGKAARLFFDLRRKGITVRGPIDIFIALTAMEYDLMLLHDDRDFDAIASKTSLAIFTPF